MPAVVLRLDGEGAFPEIGEGDAIQSTAPIKIGGLARGMASGAPSALIVLELPHGGGRVWAQTSLALFLTAADALKARHGDPR